MNIHGDNMRKGLWGLFSPAVTSYHLFITIVSTEFTCTQREIHTVFHTEVYGSFSQQGVILICTWCECLLVVCVLIALTTQDKDIQSNSIQHREKEGTEPAETQQTTWDVCVPLLNWCWLWCTVLVPTEKRTKKRRFSQCNRYINIYENDLETLEWTHDLLETL